MTRIIECKDVKFYETEERHCPYTEWLDSLDKGAQAIVEARIARLEAGNPGRAYPVGEGVHELKIDFGPGYRVYFGNAHGQLVIVLAGGTKRHQGQDITTAKQNWKDWKARYEQKPPKPRR